MYNILPAIGCELEKAGYICTIVYGSSLVRFKLCIAKRIVIDNNFIIQYFNALIETEGPSILVDNFGHWYNISSPDMIGIILSDLGEIWSTNRSRDLTETDFKYYSIPY